MHYAKQIVIVAQLIFGGLVLSGCNGRSEPPQAAPGAQSHETSASELPEWSLAKSDSTSFAPPVKVSRFEFRPPSSFQLVKNLGQGTGFIWASPVRKDETYAHLMVVVAELTGEDAKTSLEDNLREVMETIKRRRSDWSETAAEQGKINGLRFIRSSWSGVPTDDKRKSFAGRKMHGIVYLTIQNDVGIQIMCQDVEPDHAESLKQAAAAAMTFRAAPP
jgi:hypothetical protein